MTRCLCDCPNSRTHQTLRDASAFAAQAIYVAQPTTDPIVLRVLSSRAAFSVMDNHRKLIAEGRS